MKNISKIFLIFSISLYQCELFANEKICNEKCEYIDGAIVKYIYIATQELLNHKLNIKEYNVSLFELNTSIMVVMFRHKNNDVDRKFDFDVSISKSDYKIISSQFERN